MNRAGKFAWGIPVPPERRGMEPPRLGTPAGAIASSPRLVEHPEPVVAVRMLNHGPSKAGAASVEKRFHVSTAS
jgi:hypothetical protein